MNFLMAQGALDATQSSQNTTQEKGRESNALSSMNNSYYPTGYQPNSYLHLNEQLDK